MRTLVHQGLLKHGVLTLHNLLLPSTAHDDEALALTRRYGFGTAAPSPALVNYVEQMNSRTGTEVVARYLRAVYTHARYPALEALKQTKTLVIPNLTFVTATAPTTGPGPRVLTTEASITRGQGTTTSTQIAIASNVLTVTGGTFPAVAPGAQVTVSGAATPGNNGTFEATAATATTITLKSPPALTDEAAGATMTVSSSNPVIYLLET